MATANMITKPVEANVPTTEIPIKQYNRWVLMEQVMDGFVKAGVIDLDDIRSMEDDIIEEYTSYRKETPEELALAFICLDCKTDTSEIGEYYMIQFDLWKQIHPADKGMLCIGCVEKRLGRILCGKDFTNAIVNEPEWGTKSERLLNRLQDWKWAPDED